MEAIFVYVTAGSAEEAGRIGRVLVDEGLAACANLIGGMRSIYRWQGAVEEAEEVVLLAKTRPQLFDSVAARVKQLHSYDCPCIVALPIVAAEPAYLRWIVDSTGTNGA